MELRVELGGLVVVLLSKKPEAFFLSIYINIIVEIISGHCILLRASGAIDI